MQVTSLSTEQSVCTTKESDDKRKTQENVWELVKRLKEAKAEVLLSAYGVDKAKKVSVYA